MDVAEATEALHAIPADCTRDTWVRAGMAAKEAGIEFEEFAAWSAAAPNYDARDARDMWRSIKPGGGVGAATLIHMARESGWPGAGSPARRAHRPAMPAKTGGRGLDPAATWERLQPASADHGYIVGKNAAGAPLDDLRVVPEGDPLRIAGEPMAGALVVPVRRADGTLSTLQFITVGDTAARLKAAGRPTKLNLPGRAVDGWHVVGGIKTGAAIYIVEGIGQAWACWKATGHAAVVTFGAGRTRNVAQALRQLHADAPLVVVPDVGKEADAAAIAREVSALVAAMPEGWPANSDVSDLEQQHGLDAVEDLLLAAAAPAPPPTLLKAVSISDVMRNPSPEPDFVWEGLVPRGFVTLFGAHGGTIKSTGGLMLSVACTREQPLFGVPTKRTRALFVSLEDGQHLVRHRLAWICRTWGIDPATLENDLHVVDGTMNPELFAAEGRGAGEQTATFNELRKLVTANGYGLIVIDNASDAYGGDEIQRRQVRAFMRLLAELAHTANCAVLLLAHVDKGTSRGRKAEGGEGYSGSTAWHNSARSRIFVSRNEDGTLLLEHQKNNLGALHTPITLEWPKGSLPHVREFNRSAFFDDLAAGREDDQRAIGLLKLIAEFEGRGQFCSPALFAKNNPYSVLRGEPGFKLSSDDTKRAINQCQRAGWIEPIDYRTQDRKDRQRWQVTTPGRQIAGLSAPSAPSAPSYEESAHGAESAGGGAPSAPSSLGGYGGVKAQRMAQKKAPQKRATRKARKAT